MRNHILHLQRNKATGVSIASISHNVQANLALYVCKLPQISSKMYILSVEEDS